MSTLSKAFDLKQQKEMVVAVGGGGKTTLVCTLAREALCCGKKVIITTTTKMYPPAGFAPPVFATSTPLEAIKAELGHRGCIVVAHKFSPERKLIGLRPKYVDSLFTIKQLDLLLVEGDGARGKPFKAPRQHEPVIPSSATLVIPVIGADCIGKPLTGLHFHCIDRISELTGINYGDPVEAEIITRVLLHQEGYKKRIPAGARWIPYINKVDHKGDLEKARRLAVLLKQAGASRVVMGAAGRDVPVREIL